jgi:ubiquinone/menaquinone biosynthesis C-methylase UbiE
MTTEPFRWHEPPFGYVSSRKFEGMVADEYDVKRAEQPKWAWEQGVIESMLDDLPDKSWVLDIPVGTGRFLPYYASRGFVVRGQDISPTMLGKAAAKAEGLGFREAQLTLEEGDARRLDLADNSVDAALMIRLTRWLTPDECRKAIAELTRVARKKVIFTARTLHQYADLSRPLDLFEVDGWEMRRELFRGLPYEVILMRPIEGESTL